PYGKYAAHILGYTGRSSEKENTKDLVAKEVGKIGKTGLEKYYNKILEGELGYVISKVTATNKEVEVLKEVKPKDNKNIQLNIDINLQQMIYERFKTSKEVGVAIVMRTNGEILSAVSYPSYDPNLFVGGISIKEWRALQNDLAHPFTNKFIHAVYPPGSTVKMGMALAFSKSLEGVLETYEQCNGFIKLGKSKHKFRCWSRWGHGSVGLRKSIRESCDVYYYNKSLKVGINAMAKQLRSFGLGVKTGIDLPREYNGVIPDKAWKMKRYNQSWYLGETVISAIGQGYSSITPMQLARHTALIATSKLVTPRIARNIDGNLTVTKSKYIYFKPHHIRQIRQAMTDVCNIQGGTAFKTMKDLPIVVAG
ncbi:MAG TPA: penicillin-binding protein 2, partial [Sulfurovum sp.]|nr:penicillin-binding protein 2 [Sulfurovum sp.]